jgi:hypothetical protein
VNILLKNKDDLLKEHPALEEESAQRIDKIQRALLENLETAVGKLNDAGCLGEHVLSPWCETRIVLRGASKGQSLNRFIHSESVKDKIGLVDVGKGVMVAGNAADDLDMFTEWPQIDDFNGDVLQKTARPAIRVIMPDAEDETLLKEASLSNKIHEVVAAILQTQATTDLPSSSSAEATTDAPCSTALEEATTDVPSSAENSNTSKPQGADVDASSARRTPAAKASAKATATPRAKTAAVVKKVEKTVGAVAAGSKAPAVRRASPIRSVTSTGASTVVNNGDTKASGKMSPRSPVAAPTITPKAPVVRKASPIRSVTTTGASTVVNNGDTKALGKTSPRGTVAAPTTTPKAATRAMTPTRKAAKPSDSSTVVRMSKSASTAKMGDVNTAPPSSPRRSPSMTRLAQLAQTPKREVTQASTTAAETPGRIDETRTPRKSSTQVPNAERLSQLAQVHKPKSLTSNELEALAIQKACEEARRLREKNTRAVQRQAAARALAAGQEANTEAPQPNSTSSNGRRSPLRTRAVANVEAVATKTKTSSKVVDVAKENQAVDSTVAKPTANKKSTTSATQRPTTPLAKRPGTVVAATRA